MRILIAGLGKSGTTALFHKIRDAMPVQTVLLFEPRRFDEARQPHVLAKALVDPPGRVDFESFVGFSHKILIVRDPRDNLISRVLYRVFNNPKFCSDEARVTAFLQLLTRKQEQPRSVSLLSIIRGYDQLKGDDSFQRLTAHWITGMMFHDANPDYFIYAYEMLVERNFVSLSNYLGLGLTSSEATVASEYRRVVRTKGLGDWRNWFTPEDVQVFRPIFNTFLTRYGYGDDWALSSSPVVLPEHATGYVRGLVTERRSQEARKQQAEPVHAVCDRPIGPNQ